MWATRRVSPSPDIQDRLAMMVRNPGDDWRKRLVTMLFDLAGRFPGGDPLLPPLSMRRFVGEGSWIHGGRDFRANGLHFAEKFSKDARLIPDGSLLDVGSGCGRIAVPLTRFLKPTGRYAGLELSLPLVQWCSKHISLRYPNFRFIHCNLYSPFYNPQGSGDAANYAFPFDAGTFDVVAATSVFTHLLPQAATRYLQECSRVLASRGRLFATFYLLDEGMPDVGHSITFDHELAPHAFVNDPANPEAAVGYRTRWILQEAEEAGFSLLSPIRWGPWAGRPFTYSGQDVLILEKTSDRG